MKRRHVAPLLALSGCRAVVAVGEYRANADDADAQAPVADASRASDAGPLDPPLPGFYLEAEAGGLVGFRVEHDVTASGSEYIVAPRGTASPMEPGTARATYSFRTSSASIYTIWGRIHSPDTQHNAFWVRVDMSSWYVWRLSTGEDWYWGAFHDDTKYTTPLEFDLAPGEHVIEVAGYEDTVSLDRLFVTSGSDMPSGNDTPCQPPDSIRLGGICVASCGSQGGTTCGSDVCAARTPIPSYDCLVCCAAP